MTFSCRFSYILFVIRWHIWIVRNVESNQFYISRFSLSFRLFNKSNCLNGDCTFITNTHPNIKNETLTDNHFQIKLYQIRPQFCCSLIACKTVRDFAAHISMTIIRESDCISESEVLFYPHFNGKNQVLFNH